VRRLPFSPRQRATASTADGAIRQLEPAHASHDIFSSTTAGKGENDDLFDLIDPSTVNTHLQGLMEGLTIKVRHRLLDVACA
jgi:hypothetical protein